MSTISSIGYEEAVKKLRELKSQTKIQIERTTNKKDKRRYNNTLRLITEWLEYLE